ncbi:DUF3800 domain-containing protein [Mesorhizobium metallidurans]|nr:hypothetical protein [Mesorhizobium metallidurans]
MDLLSGGIDLFYIDESARHPLYAATAVTVPFLRRSGFLGPWRFVWPDYQKKVEDWRRQLSKKHGIRFREELHAYQLIKGQGQLKRNWRNLLPNEAVDLYKDALATADFLPDASIITAYSTDASQFAGETGIGVCMLTLFQRMRSQCQARRTNGLVFFDEGNKSYITAFRMAQKYLPTGSSQGGWGSNATKKYAPKHVPEGCKLQALRYVLFHPIGRLNCLCS